MTELERVVRAICPDFPEDKQVKSSHDQFTWFKVIRATNTLVIPPINYVKSNMVVLDKTVEAITAFAHADMDAPEYDWDNLNLYEASEPTDIWTTIKQVQGIAQGGLVACDIETRRVEWEDNKLLSIGFATDSSTCYALRNIPINGSNGPEHSNLIWRALEELFGDKNIRFIWHNGKFDCSRLKYLCNLDARIDEDTMLKHYVAVNEKRGTHGLKDLGQLYLQAPAWDDELDKIKREYCKAHGMRIGDFMYDDIPTEVLIPYMQRDCIATMRLYHVFNKLGRPEADFIYRKLIEASNVYMRVELAGVQLDMDYLEDLEYDLEKEYVEASKHLDEVVKDIWDPMAYAVKTKAKARPDTEFNIKSPKQLKWMLETVLGSPVPNTSAETIEELIDEVEAGVITNPKAKEFLEAIGAVRKNGKYMDTYVQGLRECVCKDLRIRGTFNLHGTETGRLSSSNPNMQNIPRDKRIKNLLRAKEGYKLVQMDYSQAELRVLALLSGDPWLTQVYKDGKDLHDAVATDMFGPNFDKEQRVMAKTINFGIAYGRGPGSIARTFKKSMGEAKAIIDKWYRPMPRVKEWIENRRNMARKGEACVTEFGRERHFVLTNENLNHVQNEYINTPIQSIASDFTMFSLLEIDAFLEQENLRSVAQIVTTVHDSIILEVKEDKELIKRIADKCTWIMATVPQRYLKECPVPFRADVEVGDAWGKLKDLEEYLDG
jgi:DNA polymerase-1